jgi:hypothetical protein
LDRSFSSKQPEFDFGVPTGNWVSPKLEITRSTPCFIQEKFRYEMRDPTRKLMTKFQELNRLDTIRVPTASTRLIRVKRLSIP